MDADLTRVTTMRIPRIRHLSLRFGVPVHSARVGRGQRVHYFEPNTVFGLLRWHGMSSAPRTVSSRSYDPVPTRRPLP
jgi:hypothetical protein